MLHGISYNEKTPENLSKAKNSLSGSVLALYRLNSHQHFPTFSTPKSGMITRLPVKDKQNLYSPHKN